MVSEVNAAKKLYARFHQLNTEVEELPEIAREKKEKVEALLLHCFPWSYWYQMPWTHSLGIFLVLAGLDTLIIDAAKTDDPNKMIFDYLDSDPDPLNEEDLEDEEKSVFILLLMWVLYQMRSIFIFSESFSDLVEKRGW